MIGGVPDAFWIGSAAALGATIGSFLNVCIYRMPRRCMTIARPRHSHCPKCGHAIRWYENIPVLSWLALRGRCSGCGNPISPMYPFVEALTSALFALAAWQAVASPAPWMPGGMPAEWERLAWFGVAAGFTAGLIVATFVDFEFQIIPDQVSVTGAWIAPVLSLALPWLHPPLLQLRPQVPAGPVLPAGWEHAEGLLSALAGAGVGAGVIYGVGVLGKLAFRKEAMGFGDVKLMAFVGGILGWKASVFTFFTACFLGSVCGIGMLFGHHLANLFRSRPEKFNSYLAFGPYLAMGGLAMFYFRREMEWGVFVWYPEWLRGMAGVP